MRSLRELVEAFRTDADLKKIPTALGVYPITCIPTGKIYVDGRRKSHRGWTWQPENNDE